MQKSINLLPPEEQKQLGLENYNRQLVHFGIWIVFSLGAVMFILFLSLIFLSRTEKLTRQGAEQANGELRGLEQSLVQKQVEKLNLDLGNFQSLTVQDVKPSSLLIEFASLLPADVSLDAFAISRDDGKVEVSGTARTRASVLQLRSNLLVSENFYNVNFPLSNLQTANDVNWKYRFYIKPRVNK